MAEPPSLAPGEDFDPEQADRDVDAFIAGTVNLDGPSVAELAERVAQVVSTAWEAIERDTGNVANNKLIATMLLVSRQARQVPADEPRHWQLHAASTLLSGLINNAGPSR